MTLNPKLEKWLLTRGFSVETIHAAGLYSVQPGPDGGLTPDRAGQVLAFPYVDRGKEVNTKFRGPGKKFWQRPGAPKTFFNADILDDPLLQDGSRELVICEGELDALAFIEAAYPFVVSVPDGAPPPSGKPVPQDDRDVDYEHDEKFQYILNNKDRLSRVKRIVIAADGDEPGQRLSDELARRLQRSRCKFVRYPEGCKDANEVLLEHGPAGVQWLLHEAKPFPVRGLYEFDEYPASPPIRPLSTGFHELDFNPHAPKEPFLSLYEGAFVVVSGLPESGKSAWTMQLAYNMAALHRWNTCMASFEMPVSPLLYDMMRGFHIGTPRNRWSEADVLSADAFIKRHFITIALEPEDDETEADVDWLIDRAMDAYVRKGIKMLIVDPWNEVEHRRRNGESAPDYLNRAIRSFKRFARSTNVCTVIVAHPTKAAVTNIRNGHPMTLHDISDGSAWANKAELGVTLARLEDPETGQPSNGTLLSVAKVKFRGTGRRGTRTLIYNEDEERFV